MGNVTKLPSTKTIEIGGLTLQCRLNGRAILGVEKRLKESIMSLFMKGEGEMALPPVNKLLIILHESNTTHGVTEKKLIEAFENHIDNGGTTMELMNMVQELLDEAGFFGKSKDSEEEAENETATLDSNLEEPTLL